MPKCYVSNWELFSFQVLENDLSADEGNWAEVNQ